MSTLWHILVVTLYTTTGLPCYASMAYHKQTAPGVSRAEAFCFSNGSPAAALIPPVPSIGVSGSWPGTMATRIQQGLSIPSAPRWGSR